MSPKVHSYDTLNWLLPLFQEFWRSVLAAPWKELISYGRRGYTVSPCKQKRSWNKPEPQSIPLPWRQVSTGPYKLVIKQFGATTEWNLVAWTFLWPLYSIRWSFLGLYIGQTVLSMNPQQLSNGDPLAWIVLAKSWRLTSDSLSWACVPICHTQSS